LGIIATPFGQAFGAVALTCAHFALVEIKYAPRTQRRQRKLSDVH